MDYILLDKDERSRLFIQWTPVPYPIFVIRSPVPWHDLMEKRVKICTYGLFVPSAMSLALNDLWYKKYVDSNCKFLINSFPKVRSSTICEY